MSLTGGVPQRGLPSRAWPEYSIPLAPAYIPPGRACITLADSAVTVVTLADSAVTVVTLADDKCG